MKLSTKGCYGLRAMLDLALNFGGGPTLMRTISDKEGISRKYLHALLSTLRTAGLVRSVRRGAFVHYSPDSEGIARIKAALGETLGEDVTE